jgi:hypothetical protein
VLSYIFRLLSVDLRNVFGIPSSSYIIYPGTICFLVEWNLLRWPCRRLLFGYHPYSRSSMSFHIAHVSNFRPCTSKMVPSSWLSHFWSKSLSLLQGEVCNKHSCSVLTGSTSSSIKRPRERPALSYLRWSFTISVAPPKLLWA